MITLRDGTVIDESLTAKGFTPGNQVPNRTFEYIFIHHWGLFGQTHDGVCNFFVNGPGLTSPNYVASAGRANCLVSDPDVAWHAGVWDWNICSLGIECRPEATDGDYLTVAAVIHFLRGVHGDLPLKPHRSVYNTDCPGIWDLDRLDALARSFDNPQPQPPALTPDQQFFVDLGISLPWRGKNHDKQPRQA